MAVLCLLVCAEDMEELEVDTEALCMEDRLRSLGILSNGDDLDLTLSATFKGIDLEADMPPKKVCLIFTFTFWVSGWELNYIVPHSSTHTHTLPPPLPKKREKKKKSISPCFDSM